MHFLIADRFGNAFVWEYSEAHNKEYIIENPNRPLVMTNFSLNKHLDGENPPSASEAKSTCKRYALLTDALGSKTGISDDLLRQTHKKVNAETPASADPSRPPVRTLWHALYYPEERRMKIAFYLRDEPVPGQPNAVRVVRSDYLEFALQPTNTGKGTPPPAARAERVAAPAAPQPVAEALRAGGAGVKIERDRVTVVDLTKASDPVALLPLLQKLPDLEALGIHSKAMNDAALAQLAPLSRLVTLNLSSCSITDDGLKALKSLQNLRHLALGGTRVTDAGLATIAEMTQLETVGLRGDAITDEGLTHLATMPNLKELNASETKITDAGLAQIARIKRLEVLILNGNDITDAGLAHLEPLTGMTGLFLASTKITDAGLLHLKRMGKLSKLGLTKTAVTEQGLAAAKSFLPFWIKIEREQS